MWRYDDVGALGEHVKCHMLLPEYTFLNNYRLHCAKHIAPVFRLQF